MATPIKHVELPQPSGLVETASGWAWSSMKKGLLLLDEELDLVAPGLDMVAPWVVTNPARDAFATHLGVVGADGQTRHGLAKVEWHSTLALSPCGQFTVVSARNATELRRADGTVVWSQKFPTAAATFSLEGDTVVTSHRNAPLRVIDVASGAVTVVDARKDKSLADRLSLIDGGAALLTWTEYKRRLVIHDVLSWRREAELDLTKGVYDAAAVVGTRWLAVAAQNALLIVDRDTAEVVGQQKVGRYLVTSVAASRDGSTILTGGEAGADLWSVSELMAAPPSKKRSTSRKSAARSYRGGFFAVPADVPVERIVDAARGLYWILDNQPKDFALLVEPDEHAEQMRWFTFVGSRGNRYVLDPWIETLHLDLGTLSVALVDDQNKVYLFEHCDESHFRPSLRVVSHRYLVGCAAGEIEGDYPQKRFSHDELMAIAKRKRADRTNTEHAAVSGYPTAVDLGVDTCFPGVDASRWRRVRDTGDAYLVARDHTLAPRGDVPSVPLAAVAKLGNRLHFVPPSDRWPGTLRCDYNRFNR